MADANRLNSQDGALFREQAVKQSSSLGRGRVRISSPVAHIVWAASSIAITLLIIILLYCGSYTRRTRVDGIVLPDTGIITLKARTEGIVRVIDIREGGDVSSSQAMFEVIGDSQSSTMGKTYLTASSELRKRLDTINPEENRVRLRNKTRTAALLSQVGEFRNKENVVREQIAQQEKQVEIQSRLLTSMDSLRTQKYVSEFDRSRQELATNSSKLDLASMRAQLADISRERSEVALQLLQAPTQLQSDLNSLAQQRSDITRSLVETETQRSSVISAPIQGRIVSLLVKSGQQVSAGQPLASLTSEKGQMVAQLFVPSSSVGMLKTGGTVSLQLSAFPYQKFGAIRGVISEIAHSVSTARQGDLTIDSTTGMDSPFYKVIVVISDGERNFMIARHIQMMPGMALQADLLLEKRSLFEWLFQPAYGFKQRIGN